jgi:hypothetical protein
VRLFIDETTGGSIGRALKELKLPVSFIGKKGMRGVPLGSADEVWIPIAGKQRLLVFSSNKEILDADAQRELWIQWNVGGVFLTSGEGKKLDVMMLILKRWHWLEEIDATVTRPFAFLLPMRGRPRRDNRVPSRTSDADE